MRHLKRSFGLLAVVAGTVFALPAAAITWDAPNANLTGTNPTGGNSGPCYTAGQANLDAQPCQMTITSGGQTLKVRAYSTREIGADGLWRSATLKTWAGGTASSGFAIENQTYHSVDNPDGDQGETSPPEHAIDNTGAFDLLVVELPDAGFDLEAFKLGWAHEGAWGGTASGAADIQAWFGGNNLVDDFNFSQACFSGCTAGGTGATKTGTLADLGLTEITGLMNNTGGTAGDGGENVPIDTSITFNGTTSGKYLVLAGKLADTDDYFKVKQITGTPGVVPTPGTMALLGLGLFGLVALRRRPALA